MVTFAVWPSAGSKTGTSLKFGGLSVVKPRHVLGLGLGKEKKALLHEYKSIIDSMHPIAMWNRIDFKRLRANKQMMHEDEIDYGQPL